MTPNEMEERRQEWREDWKEKENIYRIGETDERIANEE